MATKFRITNSSDSKWFTVHVWSKASLWGSTWSFAKIFSSERGATQFVAEMAKPVTTTRYFDEYGREEIEVGY